MLRRCRLLGVVALLTAAACRPAAAAEARPLEFHVVFDRAVSAEPFTGRVYVLLSEHDPRNRRAARAGSIPSRSSPSM